MFNKITNSSNNCNGSYNNTKLTQKFFLYWSLNIPFYFIGSNAVLWGLMITLLNIVVNVLYFIKKRDFVFEDIKVLSCGISDVYLSFLLMLLSYRFYSERLLILSLFCVIWLMFFFGAVIVTSVLIKYDKYYLFEGKKTSSALGSIIGLLIARYTFQNYDISQEKALLIACVVFFALSVIFVIKSVRNILVFLLMKSKKTENRNTDDGTGKTGDGSLSSDEKD